MKPNEPDTVLRSAAPERSCPPRPGDGRSRLRHGDAGGLGGSGEIRSGPVV